MPKPTFVRPLNQQESRELARLIRTLPSDRTLRRAQVIDLSARGCSPQAIAYSLELSCMGVRNILHRFNRGGLAALPDNPRLGGPRKVTARYLDALKQVVRQDPSELGYSFSNWTVARLRRHLIRRTRVLLSESSIWRLVRKHHLVYRRPKLDRTNLRGAREYKAFLEFAKKKTPQMATRLQLNVQNLAKAG